MSHCPLTHVGIDFTSADTDAWSEQQNEERRKKWKKLARKLSRYINAYSLISLSIEEHRAWHYDGLPLEFVSILMPLLTFKNLFSGMSVSEQDDDILARCMPSLKRMDIKRPSVWSPSADEDVWSPITHEDIDSYW
ncbi:hypothetical protein C0995_015498 [Termitomyces sp. Mi166|nr:hypothetical protein C0995_015498 [Termitomyces sp. Mi166\